MLNNEEVLLRVENLRQYFGSTKAVDNITFDIKKGEVFGLVGESGCGKTTTGRSIIKLYNITGGNVFFKGIRIAAGKYGYMEAINDPNDHFRDGLDHPKTAHGAKSNGQPQGNAAQQRYAEYQ